MSEAERQQQTAVVEQELFANGTETPGDHYGINKTHGILYAYEHVPKTLYTDEPETDVEQTVDDPDGNEIYLVATVDRYLNTPDHRNIYAYPKDPFDDATFSKFVTNIICVTEEQAIEFFSNYASFEADTLRELYDEVEKVHMADAPKTASKAVNQPTREFLTTVSPDVF